MSGPILPIPQIPDGLRQAAPNGRLVIFVGTGFYKLARCRPVPESIFLKLTRPIFCTNSSVIG